MARLIECIPNFSCSKEKDEATYNELVKTAQSVPGCTLFDAQTDGNHNRCVFTLIGSPEAIEEVAFQLTKVATERIDMNKHHGEHKRMGATDVIPFVPQMDVTVEEAVEMSKRVAQRIWDELKVPSFLYEDSATRPERRNLATCRKGEFEGMPEKLLQPEWAPDYGERKIHPTAGITAIGARMPLVAFNCNLETSDVEVAKKIAKVIRGSSGGFRSCKAMGFSSLLHNLSLWHRCPVQSLHGSCHILQNSGSYNRHRRPHTDASVLDYIPVLSAYGRFLSYNLRQLYE